MVLLGLLGCIVFRLCCFPGVLEPSLSFFGLDLQLYYAIGYAKHIIHTHRVISLPPLRTLHPPPCSPPSFSALPHLSPALSLSSSASARCTEDIDGERSRLPVLEESGGEGAELQREPGEKLRGPAKLPALFTAARTPLRLSSFTVASVIRASSLCIRPLYARAMFLLAHGRHVCLDYDLLPLFWLGTIVCFAVRFFAATV